MLFDQFNDRTEAKLPLTYDVEVRYRGPTGNKPWEDTYRLDLGMYLGSALPPKGMPELVAEVENIHKEIRKWQGSSGRGLLVHILDQRRQDRIAMRRMNLRMLRQQGPKALARWLRDRALRRFGLR